MNKKLPLVVIVGRTNVGKSTLFNRLASTVKSIAYDYAGVTRDFIKDTVSWQGLSFTLIDTGGISFHHQIDAITEQARQKALELLAQGDIIIFVCDGTVGVLPEDREIAQRLHTLKKPVILTVNKSDVGQTQENIHEFARLGFKHEVLIAAEHGRGIGDLLDYIVQLLPKDMVAVSEEKPRYRVVLLGKPNVGKSSLLNLLVKQERSLVADQPGTTREAVTEHIRFYQEDIQLTDTPGLRRQRGIDDPLEQLMVRSSLRAVRNSDIVLLLIDTSSTAIADQELKLAFYAFSQEHKALLIIFNKSDISTDEYQKKQLQDNKEQYNYFLKKIPLLTISCKTGANIGKIVPLVNELWQRHSQWFVEEELTRLFKDELTKRPLFKSERQLVLYNAHQVSTAPITIMLRVNNKRAFQESQLAYCENILRKQYDLKGVPTVFIVQ